MRACLVFVLLPALACASSPPSEAPPQGEPTAPQRALRAEAQPEGAHHDMTPAPVGAPENAVSRDTVCEGAKEGEPCPPEAGFCVLDWGEPGGWSEALWCRGGVWELEQESNL